MMPAGNLRIWSFQRLTEMKTPANFPPAPARRNIKAEKYHQALALFQRGSAVEAERLLLQVVTEWPNFESGWRLLAYTQVWLGKNALKAFERASRHYHDDADFLCNWGVALQDANQSDLAIEKFHLALSINPRLARAHNNLGTEFQRHAQWERAKNHFLKAIELEPDLAEAHNNLGAALYNLRKYSEARAAIESAISIRPHYATALMARAQLDLDESNFEAAEAAYLEVLATEPDNLDCRIGRAQVLQKLGKIRLAVPLFKESFAVLAERGPGSMAPGLLTYAGFFCHYDPEGFGVDPRIFADHLGRILSSYAKPELLEPIEYRESPPLKVCFVSADFGEHPVTYFLESVLKEMTTAYCSRIEIYLGITSKRNDKAWDRLNELKIKTLYFEDMGDFEAARLIRNEGIHILVDLSGNTVGNRLGIFAWKPAPLQITWLGYFATTGVREIDYILVDRESVDPDSENQFYEKPWYLPGLRMCFTPPAYDIEVDAPPSLEAGYITFGCFNNILKITEAVVEVWARILNKVPGSRLSLMSGQLQHADTIEYLCQAFRVHGIERSRLVFHSGSPREEYLKKYNSIDLCLDPFPYTGGTTTCEALWMGVPVVTLRGATMIGRQSAGFLKAAGLKDWVAESTEEYADLAVKHAVDRVGLSVLRQTLRNKFLDSVVCNEKIFSKDLMEAFEAMWNSHRSQRQGLQAFHR